HLDESHGAEILHEQLAHALRDPQERLRAFGLADRRDEDPAVGELIDERARDPTRRRGDDDAVERRLLRPSAVSVAGAHPDVRVAELGGPRGARRGERAEALDREDLAAEEREDRGLISRAGPDLEDALVSRESERLRHLPDDRGLRDRLALSDLD